MQKSWCGGLIVGGKIGIAERFGGKLFGRVVGLGRRGMWLG